jgi:Predicted transcription factor, homolog of eukaryotic MBF1
MFHKAVKLEYKEGTVLELTFQTGEVKQYDIASMFAIYPPLEALKDRDLFLSGKLSGGYGIIWNDDLDIEAETIYEEGILVRTVTLPGNLEVAEALLSARANAGMSQKELAAATGIDQSDISKIERGIANPSVSTLRRLAAGLGMELTIEFSPKIAV